MKISLKHFPLPLTLAPAFAGSSLTGHSSDNPSILVLFTDDQAADTIRALGDIDTPNLDRLVARALVRRASEGTASCTGSS